MKAAGRGPIVIGVVLGLSTVLSAKGETTRITISGASLANSIEITDASIVRQFQVWSGPGTRSCIGGRSNCVEGTEGFIIDWLAGEVAERPRGLQQYQVSFYVTDAQVAGRTGSERLAYVVSYEFDPVSSEGYVYLPGTGDQWYALNSSSIYRGREGHWFRGTPAWQKVVVPLIMRR
jgi:hypothetical protein